MLYEDSGFQGWLRGTIIKLGVNAHWLEDLMQEALVHLWEKETKYPGQKPVWYLKSCLRHILDYLRQGRSIDSPKRRAGRVSYSEWPEQEATDSNWAGSRVDDNPLSYVCARELRGFLTSKLSPREQIILGQRCEGLDVKEIAQALNIAHQSVTKHCQHIKVVARQNGIEPYGH